jgi:uncharacterized membrane protein
MAELESLEVKADEDLNHHINRHMLDRLVMLSDGIFAISTTLAALEIKLPEHATSLRQVWDESGYSLTAYVITFLVIAMFWVGSRDIFARLHVVDRVMTGLTLAMLCGVAVIPACAHALFVRGNTNIVFGFYALVMAACGALNFAMWAYASYGPGAMRREVPQPYRTERVLVAATMPIFFIVVFFMPSRAAIDALVPLIAVLVLLRRVAIPAWFRRNPQKTEA